MSSRPSPDEFIATIRESFIGASTVYTNGSCFYFFRILKAIYPDAQGYYLQTEGHIITKIGDTYYDINGAYDVDESEPLHKVRPDGIIDDYTDPPTDASEWKFNIFPGLEA